MKLLKELLSLREEAIETAKASDIWKEHKDDIKTYITTAVYEVKEIEDSSPSEYEVFSDESGSRKLVGKFESDELEELYIPVRPNQKEDAEGFTVYRDNTEVEAFKYDGDTIKLDLEGSGNKKLNGGDYLLRESNEDNFTYTIQSAKYFETDYTEKK